MIVFLLLTVFTVRETPKRDVSPPLTVASFIEGLIKPLKYKDFRWVLITRALVTLGIMCVQPFIPSYLSDVVGVKNEADTAGKLVAVILLTATVTGMLGGKISDAIGRKKIVYVSNTLIAVCSIAFVFSHSLVYTFIVGAIYGIGYGAYFSVDWALACDTLPNAEDVGKDMGIWHVSFVLPQAFAPALAGFLLSHIGPVEHLAGARHYPLVAYKVDFTLAAAFMVLGALFLRNVRDRKEREEIATA
jgi:MFS family permease